MMEANHSNHEGDANHMIELPPTVASSTSTSRESSMDIEHSMPTVAEIHGKSEREMEQVAPSRRRQGYLVTCLIAPFVLLAVILIIVFSVLAKQDNGQANNLRDMDHSQSFTAVVDYLSTHEVSDYKALVREGSYQNQAAKYLAHLDPHPQSIPKESPASKEGYMLVQRYVMALMYYQMGGKEWKYDLNFLVEENTCNWYSWIVKPNSATPMGVQCNGNELIDAIVMIGTDMQGSLPEEIGNLSTLRVLEMDVNAITGSIPDGYHKLTALANLHLSHNQLTGTLPSYVGKFPELLSIDVSFNKMTGALPAEVATSVPKLRGIAVDNNLFSGTVPFWNRIRPTAGIRQEALEYVFLERNAFEGNIGESLVTLVPNLKVFDASDNQFKGPLPPNLFRLPELQVLDLHDNILTGPIPTAPANLNMLFLSLHKNKLSGKIPETLGNLQMLAHLDLSNNELTGIQTNEETGFGIPNLAQLTYLFLSANNFPAGPIPDWIRYLYRLEELSLKSLKLDSTIPTWIGDLSSLILLDLDDNELRGSIPTEIANLKNLQFLLLNRNDLTEAIPTELDTLSSLRLLYLDQNALTGDLIPICNRPESKPGILTADCGGIEPEVTCSCCQLCCEDGKECNEDILVPSNDPLWQFSYDRLFYSFGNFTGYFFAVPPSE